MMHISLAAVNPNYITQPLAPIERKHKAEPADGMQTATKTRTTTRAQKLGWSQLNILTGFYRQTFAVSAKVL